MSKQVYLSLQECSFSYTKNPILKSISISIHKNDKIALVGKNGVGKSTLMQILAKEKKPGGGDIWFEPTVKIGFLKQRDKFELDISIEEYLISKIRKKEPQNHIFKIDMICKELKIEKKFKINNLSGGLIRKVFLAELLINEPDVLLLDEPTNHLDIESIEWLEDYLKENFKGAFLVVSHDREFLNFTTNKVFWMDRGNIKISPKGFENFESWSSEIIEHEKRKLKNESNLIKNELNWLSKGVKARRKRNIRRKENIFELRSKFKKEKSEFIKSISNIRFSNTQNFELGPNIVAQFFNVSKNFYNEKKEIKLFKDFNYKLMRGDKIGILGKNGSGKSTFFKLLINELKPDLGTVKLRKYIEYSYFDQNGDQFNEYKSIKENMIPGGGDYIEVNNIKRHICGYLKNFLFDPSNVNDNVITLSGGQRNRLLLAKILSNPKQLIILDEPTNDLDIETLDILIDFIQEYKGTVLIASHDRDFLDKTTNKLFYFANDRIEISLDSCSDFLKKKKLNKKNIMKNEISLIQKKTKPQNNEKKIKQVLKKMEKIEEKIRVSSMTLTDLTLLKSDKNRFNEIAEEIKKHQIELSVLEKEWIELEESSIDF
tara:strand:+ start:51 stop:1853 length:1803 start_codon:yes stop_codon:yes gene_type:complete